MITNIHEGADSSGTQQVFKHTSDTAYMPLTTCGHFGEPYKLRILVE